MATFLDELARLNAQNFLGGAAVAGQAIKEQRQNENLVNLYNQFKVKREGLQTTDSQLADFNKVVEQEGTLQPGDMAKNAIAEAGANFQKINQIYGQADKYNEIYQPYITAFAQLGDEGVKIANTLSRELDSRKQMLETKAGMPIKELEYKTNVLNYAWTYDKIRQFNEDLKANADLKVAFEEIMNSKLLKDLPMGEVNYISKDKLGAYTAQISALTEAVKEAHPELSDGSIGLAINKALDATGRKVSYDEYKGVIASMRGEDKTKSFDDPFILNSALGNLRIGTRIYESIWYDPNKKPIQEAINTYMKTGRLPTVIDETTGQPKDNKELAEMISDYVGWFRPGGKYDESQDIMRAAYSKVGKNWDALQSKGKGLPSSPTEFQEIMRYEMPGGVLDYKLKYHPRWDEMSKEAKEKELSGLQEGGLVPSEEGSFWDWMEDTSGLYREFSMSKAERKEYDRKKKQQSEMKNTIRHYKNKKDLGTITVKKPFDPEGGGYDYITADYYKIKPDESNHYPSIVNDDGLIAKGRKHPTFDKTIEAEKKLGNVIVKGKNGRYYSKRANEVTSDMEIIPEFKTNKKSK